MTTTSTTNIIEPPFFDGIEDLDPNDDFGEPKKRGKLEDAAAEFRKYFEKEPWFVRILLPADTMAYLTVIVDARYWPKERVRYRPWKGYPVAVAVLPGLASQAEKNMLAEFRQKATEMECEHDVLPFQQSPEGKRLIKIANEFHEKYKGEPWYLQVFWVINGSVPMLDVKVDGRHWAKTGRKSFRGVPVVVSIIPPELIDVEVDGEEF